MNQGAFSDTKYYQDEFVIKVFPSTIKTRRDDEVDKEDKNFKKQEKKNKNTRAVKYEKENLLMIGREIGIYLTVDS